MQPGVGWLRLLVCGTLLFGAPVLRAERSAAEALQSHEASARGTLSVSVTRDVETSITVAADGAMLSDVAARLETALGVPVFVSPAAATQLVSTSFSKLPLEMALTALTPRAYVDYELRQDRAIPLEIRLGTLDDPPPDPRFPATGILITGNTEDVSTQPASDPLRLSFEEGRLTLEVDRQPLGVVIAAAAETLNVPFDLAYDAAELVEASIVGLPPDIALLRLSPNVRLNVRADLYRGERAVQRIVVAPSSAR